MTELICKSSTILVRTQFRYLVFIVLSSMLTGCQTTPKQEPIYMPAPQPIPTVDNTQAKCYQKYQIALEECQLILNHEKNLVVKDRQMVKCLSNKGFSSGMKSCE